MSAFPNVSSQSNASKRFVADQLNSLTPVELLIKIYDIAIAGCAQKDSSRVSKALVELIGSLNFEHSDVAAPLFQVYNFCLRQAKKGEFEAVRPLLIELRDAWAQGAESMSRNAVVAGRAGKVAV